MLKYSVFCFILSVFSVSSMAEKVRVRLELSKAQIRLNLEKAKLSWCHSVNNCKSRNISGELKVRFANNALQFLQEPNFTGKRLFISSFSVMSEKGTRYPENLVIIRTGSGLDLIAEMDLEDYLLGVLPSEMPASWPLESLKAQAVASRTYVLYQMRQNSLKHFDVENTIMDQVFKKKRLPKYLNEKMARVIRETKNQILAQNNKPIKSFFHSHCGGHTEMAANVWPGANGFETVPDPYCKAVTGFAWKKLLSYSEIEKKYKKITGDQTVKGLKSLQLGAQNLSGRVESVFLFFNDGSIRKWEGVDLRAALGYSKIKSTKFSMQNRDHDVEFSGKGYGHGVGLCQHGAKKMAALGKSHREILGHYYPSTKIVATNGKKFGGIASLKTKSHSSE